MINRYSRRTIMRNDLELYEKQFRDRALKLIKHYETAKFGFPDSNQIKNISLIEHTWTVGDRYFKLASKYYGDPVDWWIIALFNNKPTESDIMLGQVIYIPMPLETVIRYLRY